ncbi:unnamed protein product [Moneuplotes crassus]|uniref:Uncharacterized protein n=1 Tax=Euplotes crassus TaxID=5936 RepID=A0AAD1ULJ2_EUPCR|nr:unnamed protein product [Moneuplotes crassus]
MIEINLVKNHFFNFFEYEWTIEESDSYRSTRYFDKNLQLSIGWQIIMDFLKKIPNFKLLNFKNFSFDCITTRNKRVIDFLSFSFPKKVIKFGICHDSSFCSSISPYFNAIIRQSSRVLERVCIFGFKINAKQFKRLMVAYTHVQTISLIECKLSFPDAIDFGGLLKNTKIRDINLNGSRGTDHSGWGNNPDEFNRLIQSLASSYELKLSLGTLIIIDCGISLRTARNVLDENGLENVFVFIK